MTTTTLQLPASSPRPVLRMRRAAAVAPAAVPAPDIADDRTATALAAEELDVPETRRFDDAALVVSSLDSTSLLGGRNVVQIAHNGFVYRLQATKLGKLILTK